jgi:GNAT superfamily N-acetyltransferase
MKSRHPPGIATTSDISIRTARPVDLAGVLNLYRYLHPDDPAPDAATATTAWSAMTNADLMKIIVADVAGRLVSTCTLVTIPNLTRGVRPYGLVENVVTHPDHRRTGLGRAVLSFALDTAWQAGCYKVMLATGSRREETLRFYEACRFRTRRQDLLRGPSHIAKVLRRSLIEPAESLQVEAVPLVELDAFLFQQALLQGISAIA